jgi:hypothetical protein
MKLYKTILILLIATLLIVSAFLFGKERNSNKAEKIRITDVSSSYNIDENIIVRGVSQKNSDIIVFWNNGIGLINSSKSGKWVVNLGKMPEGKYSLQVLSRDSKTSDSIAAAQISVIQNKKLQPSPEYFAASILNFFTAGLSSAMSQSRIPEELKTIQEETPQVLQGKWNLIK